MENYADQEKRTRVGLGFIMVALTLVTATVVAGYISWRNFEAQFHAQVESQLTAIAHLKEAELVDWLTERLVDGLLLGQNRDFAALAQAYLADPGHAETRAQMQNRLKSYRAHSEYDRISLLDPGGQTRLTDSGDLPPVDDAVAGRIAAALQARQPVLVDFYHSAADQSSHLAILTPIIAADPPQPVIGLVVLQIDPRVYLYPYLQHWPLPSASAETLLARRHGAEVEALNPLRFMPEAALTLRSPLTDTHLPAVQAALGRTGPVAGQDYRNAPVVANVRAIPATPWLLVAKVDAAEAYAPLTTRLWEIVIFFGALILAVAAGVTLVWRQQELRHYRQQATAAAALQESEERLTGFLNAAPDATIIANRRGQIILTNAQTEKLFGYSQEELLGLNVDVLVPARLRDTHHHHRVAFLERPINRTTGIQREVYALTKDGREFPAEISLSHHQVGDEAVALSAIRDITERKQTELLVQAQRDLARIISTVTSSQAAWPLCLEIALRASGLDSGGIYLFTDDEQTLELVYHQGLGADFVQAVASYPADSRSAQLVLAGQTLYLAAADLTPLPDHQAEGLQAIAVIPIRHQARALGCINAASHSLPEIADFARHALETVAAEIGNFMIYLRAESSLHQSEERFRTLYETMAQGVIYQSADGQIISANPAAERILGLTLAQIQGRTSVDPRWHAIHEDGSNFPGDTHPAMVALATGQPVHHVVMGVFQPQNERYVWININAAPQFKPGQSQPHQVYATFEDITERKINADVMAARLRLVELAATHSVEALLQATLDELGALVASPIGFYHFVEADQTSLTLQAWSTRTRAEFCVASVEERHYPLSQAGVWADCARERRPLIHNNYAALEQRRGLPEGHAVVTREAVVPVVRGERMAAIVGLGNKPTPYTPSDLEIISLLADMSWDIVERKQSEEKLRELNRTLETRVQQRTADLARASRAKDEFLANMSHELRTPLNAVLNFSEILLECIYGPLTEPQQTAIQHIESSGRHLLALINDILDLSKVEAGQLDFYYKSVPVVEICQASLLFVKEIATKKSLKLSFQLNDQLAEMDTDPKRLKQMLVNLLSNAVKFTPTGGQVSLTVTAADADDAIRFAVQDSGIGIAPENMVQLFQPFMQVDSSLSRQYEGSGLGLALVRRLVELHGGSISVESQVGQGSCFTLALPYRPPAADSRQPAPHPGGSLPRSALVVEDTGSAAEQLTRYLHELNMQTVVHPQGQGALEQAIRLQPDVIILDLLLPDQSGWEVLAQLKAETRTRDIPVIIVSIVDERGRGLAAGAADYLVKPISREMLRQAIMSLTDGPPVAREALIIAPPRPSLPVSGLRILLAEDNPTNIEVLHSYLTARGYSLQIARDGQAALALAVETGPALILMDIQMPNLDGLEVTRRLRAMPEFSTTPIIALTALAMPGDRERCLEAGANEYITKPASLKRLVATMEQLLLHQQ